MKELLEILDAMAARKADVQSPLELLLDMGETPSEAGPDFSAADLKRAQGLFQAVAPPLWKARPERF